MFGDLDTYCELKWVKVNTSHDHQILVGSYYREPKSTLDALDELDLSLIKAETLKPYKTRRSFWWVILI